MAMENAIFKPDLLYNKLNNVANKGYSCLEMQNSLNSNKKKSTFIKIIKKLKKL